MISVVKNDEATKNIVALKKSITNTAERKTNNTPKIIAVNWDTTIALDRVNRFIS
tara:strand:+ start:1534 stop:1698 length:165 start_codon:yes stop_codon:yes gene_type:complete